MLFNQCSHISYAWDACTIFHTNLCLKLFPRRCNSIYLSLIIPPNSKSMHNLSFIHYTITCIAVIIFFLFMFALSLGMHQVRRASVVLNLWHEQIANCCSFPFIKRYQKYYLSVSFLPRHKNFGHIFFN